MPVANNPLCKYNPDLPEFKVSGVNSECGEQAIHWVNKLKFSVGQMSNIGTVKTLLLRCQQEIATTPDSIL